MMPATFEETVNGLGLRFFSGLQAITGSAKCRITVKKKNARNLDGSVRLDDDLKSLYPTAHRWDYVVAYNLRNESFLFYIEIHPACATSEAKKVVVKKEWLDNWLKGEGQRLKNYTSKVFYYWVATDRVPPLDSPVHRIIARKGIKGPVKNLEIK